jgi:dTMP kinase
VAELLLYEAARAQHTFETIRPALAAGRIVLSERYTLATLAYQGFGRGIDLGTVRSLNGVATGGLKPDLTFLLDMPEAEAVGRARARGPDRLERESLRFHRRVRKGYLALARREPRIVVLDARADRERLRREILARVRLGLKP